MAWYHRSAAADRLHDLELEVQKLDNYQQVTPNVNVLQLLGMIERQARFLIEQRHSRGAQNTVFDFVEYYEQQL